MPAPQPTNAPVGRPDTLAKRIDARRRLRADTSIFSTYPYSEEAFHAAEPLFAIRPLAGATKRFARVVDARLFGRALNGSRP